MKSKFGAASKKKGGKKNDLSLLEDALVGNAEKKVRQHQQEGALADEICRQRCAIYSIDFLPFCYQKMRGNVEIFQFEIRLKRRSS